MIPFGFNCFFDVTFRCGHCQEFSPLFEELAAELRGEMLFVKIDGTTNEAPAVFPLIQAGMLPVPFRFISDMACYARNFDIAIKIYWYIGQCAITIYNHFTGFPIHILREGDRQDEPRQVHRRQKRQVTPKIHKGELDAKEKVGGYHARCIWIDELGRQRISTFFRDFCY